MTLFDLKEKLATLNAQIKADADWIAEKAADPTVSMDDINAKKTHRDELTVRRDLIQAEHDEVEKQQREAVGKQSITGNPDKDDNIKDKAAFYRAAAFGDKETAKNTAKVLGGIPAGDSSMGNGSNLLPTNLASELITEPFEQNSLRQVEQTSQVAGLEEPRLIFTLDDEDLLEDVVDDETAKEIETSADLVTYGRYKTKVKIEIADTVVYGTDTNLVTTVENGLRSALARKEKLRAFAQSADDSHKHMSFYMNGIKGIAGTTIVAAIMAALGDLDDLFRANASVVMRSADWYTYIHTLTNQSDTLFTAKPQDVLGVPVIFNDRAVIPIVGDFNYAKQNYDPTAVLDSDKDVDKGVFKYVLTVWGDHQIKLKSAFRLAIVAVKVIGGVASRASATTLKADPIFNNDTPISTTYAWESDAATEGTFLSASGNSGYQTNTVTVDSSTDAGIAFRCKMTDTNGIVAYTNIYKMAGERV